MNPIDTTKWVLSTRGQTALQLTLEYRALMKRIRAFNGEQEYDDDDRAHVVELRNTASDCVCEAAHNQMQGNDPY